MSGMDNLNKIGHVKLGDSINYYKNGVQAEAKIVGINGSYLTVSKADSTFETLLINDTLFIKDILTTKSWNDMNMEERTEQLQLIKAYSPRYLSKTWEQLPKELQTILKAKGALPRKITEDDDMGSGTNRKDEASAQITGHDVTDIKHKSDQEQGAYGNIGGRPHVGISTDTKVDAEKDYEGQSHEDYNEQFKHESKKPKVDDDHKQNKKKQNGEEKDLSGKKTKTEWNGMMSSKSHQEMLWESWLKKDGAVKPSKNHGKIDNHKGYWSGGSKDMIPNDAGFELMSEAAKMPVSGGNGDGHGDRKDKPRHQKYGETPRIMGQSHSPAMPNNEDTSGQMLPTWYLDTHGQDVKSERDALGGKGGGKARKWNKTDADATKFSKTQGSPLRHGYKYPKGEYTVSKSLLKLAEWLQKENNTSDNGSVDNALNSNMDGIFNIRHSDKNGRYTDQSKDKKSD